MSELSKMRAGRPYWSAFQSPEGDTRPVDPLGFDMYAARLGNLLLPGITGRTRRARYLGMVCAGLLVSDGEVSTATLRLSRARRDAFLPFERGWALANCERAKGDLKTTYAESTRQSLKPEYQGFRGANNVLGHWRELKAKGRGRVNPVGYTLLQSQAAQGGLGAYLVTLDSAGLVDKRSLGLREAGRELADAFLGDQRRNARRLLGTKPQTRGMTWQLGEAFHLPAMSEGEAAIIRRELFDPDSGSLALAVRGIGTTPRPAEGALQALARSGKEPAAVARYTLGFDALRQPALRAFGALGNALESDGELATKDLPDEAVSEADHARKAAQQLESIAPPAEMTQVQRLASTLAATRDEPEALSAIVTWHQEHRAAWISQDGRRFLLGRKGNFDYPVGFHGYTVPSYFSLLIDIDGLSRGEAMQAGIV